MLFFCRQFFYTLSLIRDFNVTSYTVIVVRLLAKVKKCSLQLFTNTKQRKKACQVKELFEKTP